MSYAGFPPNEFAMWLSQQVQQGNQDHHQALLNQFHIPQYTQAPRNQPASYPGTPQGQVPSASFPTNITSSGSMAPFPNPYPMNPHPVQFPVQFPRVPFPHAGISAPAYGSLENFQRPAPQHGQPLQSQPHLNDYLVGSQQLQPSQSLQQNYNPLTYRSHSSATNWTTIHPTLGLCVLVPIGALSASAPQSPTYWTTASTAGSHHRDQYNSRVARLRRRHSRELTPYVRYTSPSPSRSFSPYLLSPSSSVTVTPTLLHRRLNTLEYRSRSTPRSRGIGGSAPPRGHSVPRPSIEASVSTVRTCSQCGATGADSSYEPFTDGHVAPARRGEREDTSVGQGESSRGRVEAGESPAEARSRFQASVEEVDD